MKNILLAFVAGISAMASAQHKISGTVSAENNIPVAGASVYAPELHKGTITGSDGKYSFSNLPSGNIRLIFSIVGYETLEKVVPLKDADILLDIRLAETVHQMDEVIVSTAFNKVQSQNVMKVEHAGIKQLQQKGMTTLAEGLTSIPGVSQVSTGASVGKPVIRGLSGNRVLVYAQGVRLENQQFGDEHGLGLNDSGVESVEVIKGPASLLYGSDALGGVLYFNPEKFADANTVKADLSQKLFLNTLGTNTSFGVKGSAENWKFLARGSYSAHSDYKTGDGDRVTNTRFGETDLKAGIGYSDAKISSIFRYNFNALDLGIPEFGIAGQSNSKNTLYPKQHVYNHIASLHNNFFFGNSTLDADIGYIFNDRSEFAETSDPNLHMKLETLNYDLRYHFPKSGKLEAIAGIQGMTQSNRNSGPELLIPDASTVDLGTYGTVNYQWEKLTLQAGLRYDTRHISTTAHGESGQEGFFPKIDRTFQSANASAGMKADLLENLSIRINLASGFRAPNLAELTSNGVHEGTNRYEVGNKDLSNEKNFQSDVNIEFKNRHFEFFANAFYNNINDYIYLSPRGEIIDGNNVYDYIQGNAALYGGEAGIHLHPHPLDWLHFESSIETVTGKRSNGDYLPLIPATGWDNTLRAEFAIKKWLSSGYARIDVNSTLSQNNVSGVETRSAGYTLVNSGVGGKFTIGRTKFDADLNANNLFDKSYVAHLSRLKSDGIPNIGRNIILNVSFSI